MLDRRSSWLLAPLLALLAFTLAGAPALGGVDEADVRRPELVRNERVPTTWLTSELLACRIDTADGGWRHELVAVETGARRPAFDHDAVASRLGALLEREIDPARVPIRRLALEGRTLLALVGDELRTVAIATGAGNLRELPVGQARPFLVEPAPGRRSRDDGGPTQLRFVNGTGDALELLWLDRDGGERSYGSIDALGSRVQHTYAGHLWIARDPAGRILGPYRAPDAPAIAVLAPSRSVPEPPAERAAENVSPDGRWAIELDGHDLVLRDRESGDRTPLTTDGSPADRCTHRIAWSPTSTHALAIRVEPAEQRIVHLLDVRPADRLQPRLLEHRYVKPGDPIDRPRPILVEIDAAGGAHRVREIDASLTPNTLELTHLDWLPDGSAALFVATERGHRRQRVVAVDAATATPRVLIEEAPSTFVDTTQKTFLHRFADSSLALWASERDGWNHLYLYDLATGAMLVQTTRGRWVMRGVDHVDEETRRIRFRALGIFPGEDPYHVHHGMVDADGSDLVWLTAGNGTHELDLAPDGAHYVDRWSRADRPPVHELRRTVDGALVTTLAEADWSGLRATGWRPPEVLSYPGRDGQTPIWGLLFAPPDVDTAGMHAIVEQIYAGPHDHHVPKDFRRWHDARRLAALGFVVVCIDGMGTNWRHKAFHDVAWQNLRDAGLPDRIAWIRAAARERPWMDLERVGIVGGSAGGQNALAALLFHGDFYRAAAADCGCHDNRMDKRWWNEAWMGWPGGEQYARSSNVEHAHLLEGDLLLVVGAHDRNVDPASTKQVVDALVEADKEFELLVMPSAGHGAADTPYGRRRVERFLVESLAAPGR